MCFSTIDVIELELLAYDFLVLRTDCLSLFWIGYSLPVWRPYYGPFICHLLPPFQKLLMACFQVALSFNFPMWIFDGRICCLTETHTHTLKTRLQGHFVLKKDCHLRFPYWALLGKSIFSVRWRFSKTVTNINMCRCFNILLPKDDIDHCLIV